MPVGIVGMRKPEKTTSKRWEFILQYLLILLIRIKLRKKTGIYYSEKKRITYSHVNRLNAIFPGNS